MERKDVSTSFIDLASFGKMEENLYNQKEIVKKQVNYFFPQKHYCPWFTNFSLMLGEYKCDYNQESKQICNVPLTRTVDIIKKFWLEVAIPELETIDNSITVKWQDNLLYKWIKKCSLTEGNNIIQSIDSYYLELNSVFEKKSNIVGDSYIYLPLLKEGIPMASLAGSNLSLNLEFEDCFNLVIFERNGIRIPFDSSLFKIKPLLSFKVYCESLNLSGEGRKQFATTNFSYISEFYTTFEYNFDNKKENKFTLLNGGSVKYLLFGCKNKDTGIWTTKNGKDPIERVKMCYGNNLRCDMDAKYYSEIHPYLHNAFIPEEKGYHMYAFQSDLNTDISGSTNFDMLLEPNITITPSTDCEDSKFIFVIVVVSHNLIKIENNKIKREMLII